MSVRGVSRKVQASRAVKKKSNLNKNPHLNAKTLHFNAFHSLNQLNPLHAALLIQNIAEKENINAEKMLFTSKLEPSRSHRTHIYHIFYRDVYQRCTRTREPHV